MGDLNIYQKLIKVRESVTYLKKENPGHQYVYVSSSQVLASIRQTMDEMGLLLVPKIVSKEVTQDTVENKDKYNNLKRTTTYFTELNMEFVWINADDPSETITCPWYGQGVDIAGEKGVGKALTYAEKYFMLKFFNIATDKDDPDAFQQKHDEPQSKKNGQKTQAPAQQQNQEQPKAQNKMDWPAFWKNVEKLGYKEVDVLGAAALEEGKDVPKTEFLKWSRKKVAKVYGFLKNAKREEMEATKNVK